MVGLVIPLAGLITGSIAALEGRALIQPLFLMGVSSPVVAIGGLLVGLGDRPFGRGDLRLAVGGGIV